MKKKNGLAAKSWLLTIVQLWGDVVHIIYIVVRLCCTTVHCCEATLYKLCTLFWSYIVHIMYIVVRLRCTAHYKCGWEEAQALATRCGQIIQTDHDERPSFISTKLSTYFLFSFFAPTMSQKHNNNKKHVSQHNSHSGIWIYYQWKAEITQLNASQFKSHNSLNSRNSKLLFIHVILSLVVAIQIRALKQKQVATEKILWLVCCWFSHSGTRTESHMLFAVSSSQWCALLWRVSLRWCCTALIVAKEHQFRLLNSQTLFVCLSLYVSCCTGLHKTNASYWIDPWLILQ